MIINKKERYGTGGNKHETIKYAYIESLSLEGQVSSFKTLNLVAIQSVALKNQKFIKENLCLTLTSGN